MTRFAIVYSNELADAVVRVAPRLRDGRVAAVVDADPPRGRRWAEQLGGIPWAESIEQLHQQCDGQFDAWVVATPAGLVVAPDRRQPLRFEPERWADLPAGALWGHAFRFRPGLQTIKQCIDRGQLGDPGLIRIHDWQPTPPADVRLALAPQLDLACWLMGQVPQYLMALAQPTAADATAPRYGQVHLGFADDRMAIIACATGLPRGDGYYTLSVIGSAGAAYADDHHNAQLVFTGGHPEGRFTNEGDRAILAAFQEFADARSSARPPACGELAWNRARRLVDAVGRSLATGQAVSLEGVDG